MTVTSWAAQGDPRAAFALLDPAGAVAASRTPDLPFYSASTVKLGLLLAAVLEPVDPAATIVCRRRFASGVAGAPEFGLDPDDVDAEFPADGVAATVRELAEAAIVRSSNEATNLLFEFFGAEAIARVFARCGADRTRFERRIGDIPAREAGLTNETTAGDLARIMRTIVAAPFIADADRAWMLRTLAAQRHVRLGVVVPDGVPWGSKSGDVPGIEHDVAYAGGPDDRWCVAVCTSGYEPEQGRELIAAVGAALLVGRL